jgi:outer membrane protein TolC
MACRLKARLKMAVRAAGIVLCLTGAKAAEKAPAAGDGAEPRAPMASGADGQPTTAAATSARPADTLTLTDAIALALANNRSLILARLNRRVERFDLVVAEDEFVPDIDLVATAAEAVNEDRTQPGTSRSITHSGDVSTGVRVSRPAGTAIQFSWATPVSTMAGTGVDGNDTTVNPNWQISISQPLLRGAGPDANTANLANARDQEEVNRLTFRAVLMTTISDVIATYRALLRAQQQMRIAELSLTRSRDLLRVNKVLIDTGRMAAQDLVQSEADVAERELALVSAENQLDSAQLALLALLDIGKTRVVRANDKLVLPEIALPGYEKALEIARDNRPDYLALRLQRGAAERGVTVARNNRLWDLSLTASLNGGGTGSGLTGAYRSLAGADSHSWNVGVVLSIPLYGDLSRRRQVLGARTALEAYEIAVVEMEESIEIAVLDALRSAHVARRQVDLARRAYALGVKSHELERNKLRLGQSSNFEVVRIQADLVTVELSQLNAVIAYLDALTRLDQVLGTTLETWRIDVRTEEFREMPE